MVARWVDTIWRNWGIFSEAPSAWVVIVRFSADTVPAVEALLEGFYRPLIENGVEAVRDAFREVESASLAA